MNIKFEITTTKIEDMTDDELDSHLQSERNGAKLTGVLAIIATGLIFVQGLFTNFRALSEIGFTIPVFMVVLVMYIVNIDRVKTEQRLRKLEK